MREGFYWDSGNVIHEDGYINLKPNPSALFRRQGKGWDGIRHYFLKDLQQPQRWIATVELYALHFETLSRFDLSQLSPEKIRLGMAFSQLGDTIYKYSYAQPQYCFNAIYDNMPMEGQWPWPRRDTKDKPTDKKAVALAKEKP
ncbi:hypothetical protein F4824DRAFT_471666 [Ustulina deusta]|nr:hypothetical protein F4824DRAFT_471666 [Ustulina deusta]